MCVVQDKVDATEDERLADFVVNNHIKLHPNTLNEEVEDEDSDDENEVFIF